MIKRYFNDDLNLGYLVYMVSLYFSGSTFLINLQQQFHVRKIFSCMYIKFFGQKFLQDLQPFHFVFKVTILKMCSLCSRSLFY